MALVTLDSLKNLEIAKGINARIVTAETMTVAHVHLDEGAVLPEHSHYHEQVVNVIEGELELVVNGTPHTLTAGRVMVLEPNTPHSGRALTFCKVIDVFHPIRQDFSGTGFAGYTKAE